MKKQSDKDLHRYDDIIDLPHHVSKNHPQMSMINRAAQFSPFQALTGYGDAVKEAARLTDAGIELNEDVRAILDGKFAILKDHLKDHPEVTFTCFIPDPVKEGGSYTTVSGRLRKIDDYNQVITMDDSTELSIENICGIDSTLFKDLGIQFPY